MKVLLMGGSGIISSEICNLAINNGCDVTIMNRGLRKEKMNPLAKSIICDLKNESVNNITRKLDPAGYDVIIDFVSYYREQLQKMLSIVDGRCKQFIFISSATAYISKSDGTKYTENDAIGNTGWQYATEKANCEKLIRESANRYSFNYTIIRPYITYGETRIPYQVVPLSYYTLINRIVNNKPIPLFGKKVYSTLTTAEDFAVGAVGLFLNPNAYGQAFHITGECETTWEEVLITIAHLLEKEPIIVRLDTKELEPGTRKLGFDVEEIVCDKARNMLFDNQKIKSVVPEFEGKTRIEEALVKSIDYFKNNKSKQIVDYAWDARIDAFLSKTGEVHDSDSISIDSYSYELGKEERRTYLNNRSDFCYFTHKIINKLIRRQ